MKKKLCGILVLFLFVLSACAEKVPPVDPTDDFKKPAMITLDKEVTKDMDFFKDGYEIVKVESYGDGDTTRFKLKQGSFSTRYLATDAPETSNGIDPWGVAAKDYLNDLLKNADEIVLQKDPILDGDFGDDDATFDKYDRLLAHVFVDGELVQYKMVEESLAWVKYLYYDYLYNTELINLERYVQENDNRRVHNPDDLDPNYNYGSAEVLDLAIKDIDSSHINSVVKTTGVVTAKQGLDFFIENDGGAIFVYTNRTNYVNIKVGSKIELEGNISTYNNQLQITNLTEKPVILEDGVIIEPKVIEAKDFGLETESLRVKLEDVKILDNSSQNLKAVDKTGKEFEIRIDDDVFDYIKPSDLESNQTYDLVGNVGRYQDKFQLVMTTSTDVTKK